MKKIKNFAKELKALMDKYEVNTDYQVLNIADNINEVYIQFYSDSDIIEFEADYIREELSEYQ